MSFFHFEDYAIGAIDDFGALSFDEADIGAFRARYDPLVDGAPLTVSLWHLTAAWMGLKVRAMQKAAAKSGLDGDVYAFSPGVRKLELVDSARADDRLRFTGVVLSKRRSASMPGWGIIEGETLIAHVDGRPVARFRGYHFAPLRAAQSGQAPSKDISDVTR